MDGQSLNITTEKIQQLKALFPEVFSEDKIDFQRLKIALGEDTFVKGEHYELSWAGKTEARKEIQKQSSATLNPQDAETLAKANNHLFIEGENLEVLRTLQKSYFGKVKMIYIDPPYNTGNDSFVYPDNFEERQKAYKERAKIVNENGDRNSLGFWQTNHKENGQFHSVWLSMMYPRLYLSRNLLKEDGVIFISIDDNEASNLKLLCDEVFGEENFVGELVWKKKQGGGNDSKFFIVEQEYIFVYAKNINMFNLNLDLGADIKQENYPFKDNKGSYGLVTLDKSSISFSASLVFEIEDKEGNKYMPRIIGNKQSCWRWSKKKVEEDFNQLVFKDNKVYTKYYKPEGFLPKTLLIEDRFGRTGSGGLILKDLFGDTIFEYSKPTQLIKHFVQIATLPEENHIILDFFAGSGTTAQAVMELNEEDGGNRQFICVQMPEPTDENSEARKAGYKTIADITKARIRKVIEKIEKERTGQIEFSKKTLPSFQHFVLSESNFKVWRSDIQGKEAIALQLFEHQQSEKESDTQQNLFVELCLKSGLGLNVVYKQENNFYKTEQEIWFCFEKYTTIQKEIILTEKPQKLIYLNSCFESDVALSNFQLELKEYDIKLQIV